MVKKKLSCECRVGEATDIGVETEFRFDNCKCTTKPRRIAEIIVTVKGRG